jgi:hypothetical protein
MEQGYCLKLTAAGMKAIAVDDDADRQATPTAPVEATCAGRI